jgi:cbb3-type cytochrome oxidase subunit 1
MLMLSGKLRKGGRTVDWEAVGVIFLGATMVGILLSRMIWQARLSRPKNFQEAMRDRSLFAGTKDDILAWILGGVVFAIIATPIFFLIMKISN